MYKRTFESIWAVSLIGLMLVFSGWPVSTLASNVVLTFEQCDINDDGTVNSLDLFQFIGRIGDEAGTLPYRAAFDVHPDGIIDLIDYQDLILSGCFGAAGIATTPTTVSGRVFDGLGNPLPGVTVEVGEWAVGQTDQLGGYSLDIPAGDTGETLITFDGSTVLDPTPEFLSGQYPTIPNKPIYVNGGTEVLMRDMSLPERDLAGALTLNNDNSVPGPVANSRITTELLEYNNGGVKMLVPEGCQVNFNPGEDMVLSITRVDPSMLPVPMPPGLASSIFVTYQPGGTVVDCPNGGAQPLVTKFNNDDGFSNAEVPVNPDNPDQPFLAGVVGGVFQKLATVTVVESDGTPSAAGVIGPLLEAELPASFEFAWYHVDVPLDPCPRTTIIGQVKEFGTTTPVVGASVSAPGTVVALTDASGNFSIPNVPAGPNGPFCFSNPFSLRVSATNSAVGISPFTPAVPGGLTDVGMIFVGDPGTVQGNVRKLFSIDDPLTAGLLEPFTVVPLENAFVNISGFGSDSTDALGNYMISGLPVGPYTVEASFPEKGFVDSVNSQIDFEGDIDAQNFNFVSTGAVKVTVVDLAGNPIPGVLVDVATPGGPLPGGFQQPAISLFPKQTDFNGMATFGNNPFEQGVPLGPCTAAVINSFGAPLAIANCFVNEHGELAEVTIVFDDSIVVLAPNECVVGPDNFPGGNGGFEAGDFTTYTISGETAVVPNLGPIDPPQGIWMAFLSTGNNFEEEDVLVTSTITTEPFLVPEGMEKLVFCFNFLSNEVPDFVGTPFNDRLRATLTTIDGPEEHLLANVNDSEFFDAAGTGFNGQTGFLQMEIDVSAFAGTSVPCTLTLDFNVSDVGDEVVDSAGLIDNLHFKTLDP